MRDAVIVETVRSPGGRYKRGALAQTRGDEIGIQVMKGLMKRVPQVKHEDVDDVVCGCCFPEGETGMNIGRVIALGAGFPVTTSGMVVNRFCASGIQAIADATAKIRAGWSDIIVAGGCETMSHIPLGGWVFRPHPDWGDLPMTYVSMGVTAENVAADYGITREEQDKMALESNRRAHEAIQKGVWKDQIIPIEAWKYVKDKNGQWIRTTETFDMDDGVRWPSTLEGMAKLKPPFKQGGSVTAANSSQMTDGAAFSMIMSAEKAKELKLKPIAKLTHYVVAGNRPEEMGVGPRYAIPKVLKLAGLTTDDIDLFEINEAFASQSLYCCRELGLTERYWTGDVNPNGGAMAIGHPLGCTGAKLTCQILHELKRRKLKRGIVSMCIGGGMGAAGIYEML
ncbi:MAG: thiolase family protein [Deltaproteobacteria bacterium]|nr:thiolase family protein [Deltaproteobacteria bacterium]